MNTTSKSVSSPTKVVVTIFYTYKSTEYMDDRRRGKITKTLRIKIM